MKGQTIIELTDVKSGKKEKYVDNNMITNALSEILKTRGFIANAGVDQNNLIKTLLGGIVLFDDVLTESVNTLQPPTSVNMVGNAAMDVTSSDAVTEMGSFNENESGWQADNSYVAVYDFNTSQANGDIACVCLTSDVGGYIGYGNKTSGETKATRKSIYAYSGTQNGYTLLDGYKCCFADYNNSKVDVIPSEQITDTSSENYCLKTKKLKLETRKIPLKEVSIRGTKTSWVKASEREVTLPDEFCQSQTRGINVVECEDKLYLFHNFTLYGQPQTWSSGGIIYAVEIDRSYNVTLITLTNTVGADISRPKFFVNSGYVIVQSWGEYDPTNIWYRFAISDSSSIDLPTPIIDITRIEYNANGRLFSGNVVLNVIEGETAYTNASVIGVSDIPGQVIGSPLSMRQGSYECNILNTALYLASINNLETPVTKTASKTMKITYRITV